MDDQSATLVDLNEAVSFVTEQIVEDENIAAQEEVLPIADTQEERASNGIKYVKEFGWSLDKAARVAGISRNCLRG